MDQTPAFFQQYKPVGRQRFSPSPSTPAGALFVLLALPQMSAEASHQALHVLCYSEKLVSPLHCASKGKDKRQACSMKVKALARPHTCSSAQPWKSQKLTCYIHGSDSMRITAPLRTTAEWNELFRNFDMMATAALKKKKLTFFMEILYFVGGANKPG